jgi:F0F1-type ATP synthase assembly protein I
MPLDEGEPQTPAEEQRRARFRILDLSAVGLAFPIALLIGYFAGRLIGGWLGNAQLGSLIGALLGIAGGFYNLIKMVSRLAPKTTAVGAGSTIAPTSAARESEGEDPEPLDLDAGLDDYEDDALRDDR